MKHTTIIIIAVVLLAACQTKQSDTGCNSCADALIAYAEQYPEAEPTDMYKLVFQDMYGPGHLLTDSTAALRYINAELESMTDSTNFPTYEYTLCDSNFVRVNLTLVKDGILSAEQLADAMVRSAEGLPTPNHKYVVSHSDAFKAAYHPHYRIVRRDIFEQEILPLIP
jgi:hypothetical protein